jgi:hypothetical protein
MKNDRPPDAARRRFLLSDTRLRDALISVAAGLAVLGFIVYAAVYFSRQSAAAGGAQGVIIEKKFVPRPETQITFGRGGLSSRELAGEYSFRVRESGGDARIYEVFVDSRTYAARQVGERFYFLRPSAASPAPRQSPPN